MVNSAHSMKLTLESYTTRENAYQVLRWCVGAVNQEEKGHEVQKGANQSCSPRGALGVMRRWLLVGCSFEAVRAIRFIVSSDTVAGTRAAKARSLLAFYCVLVLYLRVCMSGSWRE